jgi:hypothetical protein
MAYLVHVLSAEEPLILYSNFNAEGRPEGFLFSQSYSEGEKKISLVIKTDTFNIEPHGFTCKIIMSNAYLFRTRFSISSKQEVKQERVKAKAFTMDFPSGTEMIFNSSLTKLSKAESFFVSTNSPAPNKKNFEPPKPTIAPAVP